MLRKVKVEDAVGMIIPYDLTEIVPGEYKGPAFRKGHIIKAEDIDRLKSMGKNYIYVIELSPDEVHEDDAAYLMEKWLKGENLSSEGPTEGKITLISAIDGLLKVNVEAVYKLNMLGQFSVSTIHNNTPVRKGDRVGAFRAIPLVLREEYLRLFEGVASEYSYILKVKPYMKKKVALLSVGTEIYEGRIKDGFKPILESKLKDFSATIVGYGVAPDNISVIKESIKKFIDGGAEVVICVGGMSVDADDVTLRGVRDLGAEIVRYGSPVLPGAMLMVAYEGEIPVLGVPAAAVFYKITVFDIVFPRIVAGEMITYEDIAKLGHGGYCRHCDVCNYPCCPFGKGW